ncbi:hypothetical protein [Paludibaculum fermentans]|uniref:hypothetical protein n=1 Tax=Paludibaculum fermentans TaxID=1473598 RepID=UPI003EB8FADB
MPAYILSYDLNKPGQHYAELIAELERSTDWWHYLKSTWIVIRSEGTTAALGETLARLIDENDRLLILAAKGPAAGWLTEDAWQWINQHVPA